MNTTPIPTEVIIVTINDDKVRSELHAAYDPKGLELVNSSPSSILWRWYNAPEADLASIQARPEHKGTVKIS